MKTTKNYKEITKNKHIDLVIVASYDNFHFTHVIESINSNKHVFVEKPICLNIGEFQEITKSLKKKPRIKISSNFVLRTNKTFQFIKKKIDQNKFGKTYYFEGDYNYGRLNKITDGWRSKIPFYSVMHGGGIHLIDLILWMNKSRVIKVCSEGNNISTKKSNFKFNDLMTSILKFEDGTISKVTANFGSVCPHHHMFKVYGTKRTFIHNLKDNIIYKSRAINQKGNKIYFKDNYNNKGNVLKSFINNIIFNKKNIIDKQDVLNSMKISLAIQKSIKLKKWVEVKYTK